MIVSTCIFDACMAIWIVIVITVTITIIVMLLLLLILLLFLLLLFGAACVQIFLMDVLYQCLISIVALNVLGINA